MNSNSLPLAVVTGAGSGIGAALALKCAQEGNNVALADINEQSVVSLKNKLAQKFPEQSFKSYKCDVSNSNDLKLLAHKIKSDFNGSVKYLFNNGTYKFTALSSNNFKLFIQ